MIRGAASSRPQKAPITIDDRLPLCTGEEHESGRDVCANGWAFCRDGTPSCLQQTAIFFPLLAL
jgi:hypothetical protein